MTNASKVAWPTRPDGSNMTMGEMTPEQRKAQWQAAVERFKTGWSAERAAKFMDEQS